MSKNNISFILHEPQLSENIGACARAIKNFDFNKLILVNPKPTFPNDKILATSVGAKDIIKQSKNYDKLEDAIGKIDIVATGFKGDLVAGKSETSLGQTDCESLQSDISNDSHEEEASESNNTRLL